MPRPAADFPDPVVGLLPDLLHVVGHLGEQARDLPVQLHPASCQLVRGGEHLAIDFELELLCGLVADPHGTRLAIAFQVAEFVLLKIGLSVDAVHDLESPVLLEFGRRDVLYPMEQLHRGLSVSEARQCLARQRGDPNPRLAMSPSFARPDRLGSDVVAGRGNGPGLRVGQQFQGQLRPNHPCRGISPVQSWL